VQYRVFKRFIDFIVSLIGLIILSPVLLLLTIILTFQNRGSAFFFQPRPGKNEEIFKVIKFKTMNDSKDSQGKLLPDAQRLTPIGRFIRKTSLDEIPQLINVLKGDMSLIGPRPLLPEYLYFYTDEQKKRHQVKPGITGLAQVNGRNTLKFSERLKYDVHYIENLSLALDLKILLLTVKTLVFKRDTVVNGQEASEIDDIGLTKNLKL
jgi:lipopolysaccharide/colanic/teichoic acid biosynthesis glycosyltransferase